MKVGFTGKLMGGKSSARKFLVDQGDFHGAALADQLKDDVAIMCNLMMVQHEKRTGVQEGSLRRFSRDSVNKDKEVFRPLLQWYGSEFWRDYMKDGTHWIDATLANIARIEKETGQQHFVVDDVRFANEAAALKKAGFVLFRVERPEEDRLAAVNKKYSPEEIPKILGHQSEALADTLPVSKVFHARDIPELHEILLAEVLSKV